MEVGAVRMLENVRVCALLVDTGQLGVLTKQVVHLTAGQTRTLARGEDEHAAIGVTAFLQPVPQRRLLVVRRCSSVVSDSLPRLQWIMPF
jgi:hypothetical protein